MELLPHVFISIVSFTLGMWCMSRAAKRYREEREIYRSQTHYFMDQAGHFRKEADRKGRQLGKIKAAIRSGDWWKIN